MHAIDYGPVIVILSSRDTSFLKLFIAIKNTYLESLICLQV